jgi:predicted transcriptional regulator
MKRGLYDVTGEILEEVIKSPKRAPSRVIAGTSAPYGVVKLIVNAGILQLEHISKKRNRLLLTEKGRLFLQHYRALKQLFPCPL